MNKKSIFTKIINREVPAEIIYETEKIIVIKDINPQAAIHLLIISKKEIINIAHMDNSDFYIGSEIFKTANHLSKTIPGASDFQLIINNGEKAGQTVFHLHAHFLAKKD